MGKIITKEEADNLFGAVITSVKITPAELTAAIANTETNVMFRIIDGQALILGDRRKPIYPTTSFIVGPEDVYNMYSKLIVLELLNKSKGEAVYMESRKEVFSITYGDYTLEYSLLCPPICF
jgi:hypothetical protein